MSAGLLVVVILILALFVWMKEHPKTSKTKPDRVVLFFRPTCPACVAFKPTWDDVVKSMPHQKFEEVDTDKPGSDAREKYYGVDITSVPTMFLVTGKVVTKYEGSRSKSALMAAFA
jgi:thiol-disulfide isomerase/thioredoxin